MTLGDTRLSALPLLLAAGWGSNAWAKVDLTELSLGACQTLVVDSENRPQRGQFLQDLPPHSPAMGQKAGEKWTAAVDLQPTIPKSDRLLEQLLDIDVVCASRVTRKASDAPSTVPVLRSEDCHGHGYRALAAAHRNNPLRSPISSGWPGR